MARILVQFAHPALEKSRTQSALLKEISSLENITINDLYERYPDFYIDVKREQKLLLEHDIVVFQHPFYWYSTPPIIKQWEDLVLEHGWAYGKNGTQLSGKFWMHAISSGGPKHVYQKDGANRFTILEFLRPLEQTATLCKMNWLPPFLVQGTHRLSDAELAQFCGDYRRLLELLRDDRLDLESCSGWENMNEAIEHDKKAGA